MHKEAQEELRVRLKLVVLELAHDLGVTKACREFNVPRSSFYRRSFSVVYLSSSSLFQ